MATNDALLRTCLVSLALFMLLIGIYTHSFKNMFATYVYGILAIVGILLPDWDYFDRDFSSWVYPMSTDDVNSLALKPRSKYWFRMYPFRMVMYAVVYSVGFYKWWKFVFKS